MNLRQPATRRQRLAPTIICATASLSVAAYALGAPTGDAALDTSLAERMAAFADDMAASDRAPEPFLRESAALLDLAREQNPQEVRFARSSADLLLRLGESARALSALSAVRTLDPKDQLAMIQYIDLTANAMESADARAAYLQQVVGAQGVAAEVRSHAAVALVDILSQRAEDGAALAMLDQALTLNPQNISALTTKYRLALSSGSRLDRAKALAALIQATPVDAGWLNRAARECIASGDYDGAHEFYELVFSVDISRGQSPSVEDISNLAGSELLGGSAADIGPLVKQALQSIKDDGRLYAIDLLASEFAGSKPEDLASSVAAARGVYLAQLAGVSQLLNTPTTKEMPATSPAAPFPNVVTDAAKLVAGDAANLKTAYTVALAEQLWFDLYFRAAPVDDGSIAALATLLGSDADPLIVRLQGWKLLSAGQADEAKVKFSAVADRDGYAKLGLAAVAIAQGKAEDGKAILTELVAARPDGMLSVFTALAAKQAGVSMPASTDEIAVAKVLEPLRRNTKDLIANSRSGYLLTASPINVSAGPGDVMLARVTLQNNGRAPITIGPGALVEPRFVVDVSIRGEAPKSFPAVTVGKWAGAVRLLPQQSISQVVRLDRGQAYSYFRQYPTPLMTITASVTSNAITRPSGSFPAAGGQQAMVGNVMERKPSPLFVEKVRTDLLNQMANGKPLQRLNDMELVAAVMPLLAKQTDNADAKTVAEQLRAALDKQLEIEPIPEVKAWATVARAASAGGAGGLAEIDKVAAMDSPTAKVAALVLARILPKSERQRIAADILQTTTTGPIAELAQGVYDQPDPPTTVPTTDPAASAATPKP